MEEVNPQSSALVWLLEMGIISDPNVLNSLILNIYKLSSRIKDVQFVTDSSAKKLLVYLQVDVGWVFQEKRAQEIVDIVESVLNEALPSYKKRITLDKNILNKALSIVEGAR